jgi:hypothetical protein
MSTVRVWKSCVIAEESEASGYVNEKAMWYHEYQELMNIDGSYKPCFIAFHVKQSDDVVACIWTAVYLCC